MSGENKKMEDDFVQLARIALTGRHQDVQALIHRISRRCRNTNLALSDALLDVLRQAPTRASPLRRMPDVAIPVDVDSRFQLLRVEEIPELDHEPVYSPEVQLTLQRLVQERREEDALLRAGLAPTRTVLFTGPPGVGKTLSARWVARALGRPLLILDLAAVMSSYLGRTGTNLKHVLDYAKSLECVLLLDELDAIAKRRDDLGEIGELKRLVTVLLQQLDDWPASGLLIAATNHADLLDPAIWRRFELSVEFQIPSVNAAQAFIESTLAGITPRASEWSGVLSLALHGESFSDIERDLKSARRSAALNGGDIDTHLVDLIRVGKRTKQERIDLAVAMVESGLATQRRAQELTGVARDTIRGKARPAALAKDTRKRL